MNNKAEIISSIRKSISEAAKKEVSSATLILDRMPADSLHGLQACLNELNKGAKNSTKEEGEAKARKDDGGTTVIAKLRRWLDGVRNEAIDLQTCFPELERLLTMDLSPVNAGDCFHQLSSAGDKLDELKCAVDFKKSETIMMLLADGKSKKDLAIALQCGDSYIDRMGTFNKFCCDYPALRYAPYSYNTLLQHKKAIIRAADADADFEAKLKTPITPRFKGGYCGVLHGVRNEMPQLLGGK